MKDQSWPYTALKNPTPEQRAERALNLGLGRDQHSPALIHALASEIREAEIKVATDSARSHVRGQQHYCSFCKCLGYDR